MLRKQGRFVNNTSFQQSTTSARRHPKSDSNSNLIGDDLYDFKGDAFDIPLTVAGKNNPPKDHAPGSKIDQAPAQETSPHHSLTTTYNGKNGINSLLERDQNGQRAKHQLLEELGREKRWEKGTRHPAEKEAHPRMPALASKTSQIRPISSLGEEISREMISRRPRRSSMGRSLKERFDSPIREDSGQQESYHLYAHDIAPFPQDPVTLKSTSQKQPVDIVYDPSQSAKDMTVRLALDVKDDWEPDLEEFCRFRRLGLFSAAQQHFERKLERFDTIPYIRVQYAEMLLASGNFKALRDLKALPEFLSYSGEESVDERNRGKLAANYAMLELLSQRPFPGYIQRAWGTVENTLRALSNDNIIGSTEIQLLTLCLRVLHHLELSTHQRVVRDAKDFTKHLFDWQHFYREMAAEECIWDVRDLLVASTSVFGWQDTSTMFFGTEYIPKVMEFLSADWIHTDYDEPSTMGLLDLFTSLILLDHSKEMAVYNGLFLEHATSLARLIQSHDEELMRSRPFIQWLLAKLVLEMPTVPERPDGLRLDDFGGLEIRQRNGIQLPVYIPRNGSQIPSWDMFFTRSDPAQRHIADVAITTAEFIGDYTLKAECLRLLILLSQKPQRPIADLCHLQLEVQGDWEGYLATNLSSFLVLSQEPLELEQLGLRLANIVSISDAACENSSMVWAGVMLRALIFRLCDADTSQNSPSNRITPGEIQTALHRHGPMLPPHILTFMRQKLQLDIPIPPPMMSLFEPRVSRFIDHEQVPVTDYGDVRRQNFDASNATRMGRSTDLSKPDEQVELERLSQSRQPGPSRNTPHRISSPPPPIFSRHRDAQVLRSHTAMPPSPPSLTPRPSHQPQHHSPIESHPEKMSPATPADRVHEWLFSSKDSKAPKPKGGLQESTAQTYLAEKRHVNFGDGMFTKESGPSQSKDATFEAKQITSGKYVLQPVLKQTIPEEAVDARRVENGTGVCITSMGNDKSSTPLSNSGVRRNLLSGPVDDTTKKQIQNTYGEGPPRIDSLDSHSKNTKVDGGFSSPRTEDDDVMLSKSNADGETDLTKSIYEEAQSVTKHDSRSTSPLAQAQFYGTVYGGRDTETQSEGSTVKVSGAVSMDKGKAKAIHEATPNHVADDLNSRITETGPRGPRVACVEDADSPSLDTIPLESLRHHGSSPAMLSSGMSSWGSRQELNPHKNEPKGSLEATQHGAAKLDDSPSHPPPGKPLFVSDKSDNSTTYRSRNKNDHRLYSPTSTSPEKGSTNLLLDSDSTFPESSSLSAAHRRPGPKRLTVNDLYADSGDEADKEDEVRGQNA